VADLVAAGVVIVIDDEELTLRTFARILGKAGFDARTFLSAREALAAMEQPGGQPDVVVSDLHMPDIDGSQVLRTLRERWPDIPAIVMTGDETVRSAVEAMRIGAYDYLIKAGGHDELVLRVQRAVERHRLVKRTRELERSVQIAERFEGIVGTTPAMQQVYHLVEAVAPTDATVLLLGESGTGKELVARAIHARSGRRGRSFVAINCSALTESLLESELFGHVRGAFTGASTSRIGVFEEASGGTLFLDEIGDISQAIQVRLLRALQEGEIKPVGATEIRKVDARVITATNRDLEAAVRAKTFRQDLFYRLNVLAIDVPPLRRRVEDIPLLVQHFIEKYAARYGRPPPKIEPDAMEQLQSHRWPGNVRELENAVQRAVVLAKSTISVAQLPEAVQQAKHAAPASVGFDKPFAEAKQMAVDAFERAYLMDALTRAGGNVAEAARASGLDKSNFRRLLRRQNLDPDGFREAEQDPSSRG
jgi:DNA-binding NtrC family response regulator